MSHLANISIVDCDDCKKVVALKSDEDWASYENDWIDSLYHQYCPACKTKISNRAMVEMDRKFLQKITAAKPATGAEETWSEYINVD